MRGVVGGGLAREMSQVTCSLVVEDTKLRTEPVGPVKSKSGGWEGVG